MVHSQTVIKNYEWRMMGLSGRQARKEWLEWGSESVGRRVNRVPGGGPLL